MAGITLLWSVGLNIIWDCLFSHCIVGSCDRWEFPAFFFRRHYTWLHNDHDGVSNHQPHGCLPNRLFRRRSKKTSKLRVTGLCVGNPPGPVHSPHKGPVTRKCFHLMTSSWSLAVPLYSPSATTLHKEACWLSLQDKPNGRQMPDVWAVQGGFKESTKTYMYSDSPIIFIYCLSQNWNRSMWALIVCEIFNDYFANIASSIGFEDAIISVQDAIHQHDSHPSVIKIKESLAGSKKFTCQAISPERNQQKNY